MFYISKNNLSSIGTEVKYYYRDPYNIGLQIGFQILDEKLSVIDYKKIKNGKQEITIVNGIIQDIFYFYQLDSEAGLLKIKSKTRENNLTEGSEVRYPNNNLANGLIKIIKNENVKKIHVNNGIITKVVEHHDAFFIAFLSVFTLMLLVIVFAILFNQPETDTEVPKNSPTDTLVVTSDQEKMTDSSALPIIDTPTALAPDNTEAEPTVETEAAKESDKININ